MGRASESIAASALRVGGRYGARRSRVDPRERRSRRPRSSLADRQRPVAALPRCHVTMRAPARGRALGSRTGQSAGEGQRASARRLQPGTRSVRRRARYAETPPTRLRAQLQTLSPRLMRGIRWWREQSFARGEPGRVRSPYRDRARVHDPGLSYRPCEPRQSASQLKARYANRSGVHGRQTRERRSHRW
jgi:hypothetical protein